MSLEMPKRHSIRLKGYDYSEVGAYFITICTKEKKPYFNLYPELKGIIQSELGLLANRYPTVIVDTFVVMPNHVHAIIFNNDEPHRLKIIGSFWQRNYYDRIIRNENELNSAREYIIFNPSKWSFDADNPDRIYDKAYSDGWQWLEGRR
jgi:putative transposase